MVFDVLVAPAKMIRGRGKTHTLMCGSETTLDVAFANNRKFVIVEEFVFRHSWLRHLAELPKLSTGDKMKNDKHLLNALFERIKQRKVCIFMRTPEDRMHLYKGTKRKRSRAKVWSDTFSMGYRRGGIASRKK